MERIAELRSRLDAYARQRLTPEDFVPVLEYDAEVALDDIKHDFWLALQKLEPFGVGQSDAGVCRPRRQAGAAGARAEREASQAARGSGDPNANGGRFQRAHDVLGWRMAERAAQDPLLAGDVLDLAFTVDYNQHPDFGGVQLNLVDFARVAPIAIAAAEK